MPQFHETMYGRAFFEHQLPNLIKNLSRIASSLEQMNESREKKPVTYEDFIASREYTDDLISRIPEAADFIDRDETQGPVAGFIYLSSAYIICQPDGKFYTVVERSEVEDHSLAVIEKYLWENFLKDEINS